MRVWDVIALVLMVALAAFGKLQYAGTGAPPERRPVPIATRPPAASAPPVSPRDPVINVNLEDKQSPSVGTAFSVARSGVWITARHVADGCDKMALRRTERSVMRVRRILHSPYADISVLWTGRGAPPLPVIRRAPGRGQDGYSFGFPKGDPGDVHARVIGRRTMRIGGRYRTRETVIAWTHIRRVPDRGAHLGGISGGPWVDGNGRVIGVHIAGAPRRGRSYSAAPESLLATMKQAGVAAGGQAGRKSQAVTAADFHRVGDMLRNQLTVAKVYCLVGERWRGRSRR